MTDLLHELVAAVKQLTFELGRPPTRTELENRVTNANRKIKVVGGMVTILQAAGLPTYDERRSKKERRITSEVFETSISRHLEQYEPRKSLKREAWPKIAVISDIHWPFHSQRVIDAFLEFIKKNQPEHVILNGDAWDMYSHSKFPRSHNIFTPREEQTLSRKHNEEFWKQVKEACPRARCYQMLGNHDVRPLRRVLDSYPAAEDWIEKIMTELFTFPGVETFFDSRQELMLPGNIMVHHGYRSRLGDHRDYAHHNFIVGHTHLGGSVFRQIRGQVLWELNSGVAGDPESKGLSYTPQRTVIWTPGFGWVDEHGPRFISV